MSRDAHSGVGHGQKRVEKLQIGDEVMTASGAGRPIKWIGRRSYSSRFIMGRKDFCPVCIKAGALADNAPKRDLWISPNHAMYFKDEHGGVLIEAKDLLNGVSIVQAESVEQSRIFSHQAETTSYHRRGRVFRDLHRRRQSRHVPQRTRIPRAVIRRP